MLEHMEQFEGLLTRAEVMMEVFEKVRRVASTSATVLIRGESGTGKELVAKAIHRQSARCAGPFRAVNCATFTPELLASELFGHVKGAFTGAVKDRAGLFELANGGSLLLDEIAEVPLPLQAQLLRVLQEQSFTPVGGTDSIHVDVRVLAATNKALRQEVQEGRFRSDLMYRVRVIPIYLPRLAIREGDVEMLSWHFIETEHRGVSTRKVKEIEPAALEAILDYAWPGNVRELRNVIVHALIMGSGDSIGVADLPPELRGEGPPVSDSLCWEASERGEILRAMERANGHRGKAAGLLGWSRTKLWRKLKEHRLP